MKKENCKWFDESLYCTKFPCPHDAYPCCCLECNYPKDKCLPDCEYVEYDRSFEKEVIK